MRIKVNETNRADTNQVFDKWTARFDGVYNGGDILQHLRSKGLEGIGKLHQCGNIFAV